jgi:hypothetical protein
MESIVSPAEAEAVSTASVPAVAIAGMMSPAAANKGANIARIVATVRCGFSDDALVTSALSVFFVVAMGGTKFKHLVGGVFSIFVVIGATFVASVVLHAVAPDYLKLRRVAAMALLLVVSYALPTVSGFVTTILSHATDPGDIAFGAVAAFAVVAMHCVPLFLVVRELPTGAKAHFDNPEEQAGESRWYVLYMFADGCRDSCRMLVRLMFFEDILSAGVMAVIAGIMPEGGDCLVIAILVLAVAVVHMAYIFAVRPYDGRVETVFSVLISVGQSLLAGAAVWAAAKDEDEGALVVVGAIAMGLIVLFFGQTVALAAQWLYEQCVLKPRAAAAAKANNMAALPMLDDASVLDRAAEDPQRGETHAAGAAEMWNDDAADLEAVLAAPEAAAVVVVVVAPTPKPPLRLDPYTAPVFVDTVLTSLTTRGYAAVQMQLDDDDADDDDDDDLAHLLGGTAPAPKLAASMSLSVTDDDML